MRRDPRRLTTFISQALVVAGIAFLVAGGAAAETTTFFDGDFDPSDWSSVVVGSGSASASTAASGGNPGAFRRVSLTVDSFQSVTDSELMLTAVDDPSSQGPIGSVRVSYDVKRVATTNPGPPRSPGESA